MISETSEYANLRSERELRCFCLYFSSSFFFSFSFFLGFKNDFLFFIFFIIPLSSILIKIQ